MQNRSEKTQSLLGPLAAVAAGGNGDINLLAARAANEIKRLDAKIERLTRERDDALECERLAVERVNQLSAALHELEQKLAVAWQY